MFKNWLQGDLQNAINDYGPEILEDVKLPIRGYAFLERLLEAIILANTSADFSSKELHERKLTAMKALVDKKPPRLDKKNNVDGLIWMAEQQLVDQAAFERDSSNKPRSIEALAIDYAIDENGETDDALIERLRDEFPKKRKQLARMVEDRGLAIEIVQRAALHDLAERLQLMGIDMWPDD